MKLSPEQRDHIIKSCNGREIMVRLVESEIGKEFFRCLKEEKARDPNVDAVKLLEDSLRYFISQIGSPMIAPAMAEKSVDIRMGGVMVCADLAQIAEEAFQTIATQIITGKLNDVIVYNEEGLK